MESKPLQGLCLDTWEFQIQADHIFRSTFDSDSCDSETTVTSHPSLDVATPLAMDQPAFELPDSQEEEAEPAVAAEADERSSSRGEDKHDGSSEQVPQFTAQNGPMGTQQGGTGGEEQVEGGHQTDPDPEQETFQSMFAVEQEPQSELVHTQNRTASEQESEHTQNPTETATDIKPPTEVGADDEAQEENAFLSDSDSLCPTPGPSSPVLNALNRAKQKELSWGEQWANPQSFDMPKLLGGRRRRRGITLQRSSSLPSTLLSPSRIVSSVRIQFGQGQASCSKPRYSFKYTCDGEDEEEEEEGQNNCLSTLIINPAPSSYFNNQPPRLPRETPIPPKPIPRYLMRSTCSLHSCSPPPDAHFWSTQSSPYHATPHGSQFASPYLGNQVYNMNPHLAFPYPVTQYPPLAPSSTEMQLRRVLHDIKGAVQSLSQVTCRVPPPDLASLVTLFLYFQSLAEIYQKRQSLNLFRCQMTDLEKSIIRQQALVYKHLSPADRMEVEQLQSLRSSVREELQELEQQLEDRLMELTQHTHHRVYTHKNRHSAVYIHTQHTHHRVYTHKNRHSAVYIHTQHTHHRVYTHKNRHSAVYIHTQHTHYRVYTHKNRHSAVYIRTHTIGYLHTPHRVYLHTPHRVYTHTTHNTQGVYTHHTGYIHTPHMVYTHTSHTTQGIHTHHTQHRVYRYVTAVF
uniref:Sperm-specific antigen 2 C-terminal domain-containing protein n=1 Tax=Cyclopterus lumpus TaxID=8103 RepID=A0A8C2XGU1_CYCLU